MKAIGLTNFGDPGTFEEIEVNLPIHIDKIYPFSGNGITEAYSHSKKQLKKGRILVSKT